jgi:hypothetical protein
MAYLPVSHSFIYIHKHQQLTRLVEHDDGYVIAFSFGRKNKCGDSIQQKFLFEAH